MDSSTINTQHLTEEHVEKDFEQLSNTNRLVTDTVTSIWHASRKLFMMHHVDAQDVPGQSVERPEAGATAY